MELAIRHEPEAQRFVTDVDGQAAYITYREIDERTLELDHTYVPRELRGVGIATRLAASALDYARERGLSVVPTCPFVAAYMKRHPEYRDLRVH